MKYQHLFGPVASRRLGYSLGVDLVAYKYCPLNCVYCEVQRTTHLTTKRQEFFPLEEIKAELDDFLQSSPELNFITFSGAGEPTLYSRIGELISYIKQRYAQYPLALLTNGVLLKDAVLRAEVLPCDLILPSLDAGTEEVFRRINRPHKAILLDDLLETLFKLRQEYQGQIWLEVFIIEGINDTNPELEALSNAIRMISPDRVQINSLDRPGAEVWVKAASQDSLHKTLRYFQQKLDLPVEIIAQAKLEPGVATIPEDIVHSISTLLTRRPGTAEDLARALGLHINEISKILRQLHNEQRVDVKREARGVFYIWIR